MQHKDIKQVICESSIQDDQERVATQWAKTFHYNQPDDAATNMARLLVACVARGDFKTKSDFDAGYSAPSDKLTVADYVSHASRIIIDYQGLSAENTAELLKCFDKNLGISRAATHDINRKSGDVIEGKGVLLGAKGAVGVTANDFGINIAMGGVNQFDFCGNVISAKGHCGHFYYHINTAAQALLCGLEQSGPAVTWFDAFTHVVVGAHPDQFGQTHSLGGLSDTFTAAGSLYFSDPIYQAKLMLECGTLPPAKYNGMLVKLTDDNWLEIKAFLQNLNQQDDLETLKALLLTKPAVTAARPVNSYIEIQFENYLKSSFEMWIAGNAAITAPTRLLVLNWQNDVLAIIKNKELNLLEKIEHLEKKFDQYSNNGLKDIVGKDNHYHIAMTRVLHLFRNQSDLKLQADQALLHEQHLSGLYDSLQEELRQLLNDAHLIEQYFSSQYVNEKDTVVHEFLSNLRVHIGRLQENLDEDDEDLMSASITNSFLMVGAKLSDEKIHRLDELVNATKDFLNHPPKLGVVPQAPQNQLPVVPEEPDVGMEEDQEQDQEEVQILRQRQQVNEDSKSKQAIAVRFKIAMPVLEAANNMLDLAGSLEKSGHQTAAKQAKEVAEELGCAVKVYTDHPESEKDSLDTFRTACHASLSKQRDELYKHADARRIRYNVLLALGLLGIGYLIAIGLNKAINGNFLFFNGASRDSIVKTIDKIQDINNQPRG